MTTDPHASDAPTPDGPHGTTDHGDDHGDDDHAHASEDATLGPVDGAAWGAGALGIGVGLLIAVCFALATGAITA
jgi:hypothetical protein